MSEKKGRRTSGEIVFKPKIFIRPIADKVAGFLRKGGGRKYQGRNIIHATPASDRGERSELGEEQKGEPSREPQKRGGEEEERGMLAPTI